METEFVTGMLRSLGGSGDPSPFTAFGALQGLMAAVKCSLGNEARRQVSFACRASATSVWSYAKLLRERGAKVFVTDINTRIWSQRAVDDDGCRSRGSGRDLRCRLPTSSRLARSGGTINDRHHRPLKCKIIAGAANNQLANDEVGDEAATSRYPLRP